MVIVRGNVVLADIGDAWRGTLYLEQRAAGSPIGVLCPGFVTTDPMDSDPTTGDASIAHTDPTALGAAAESEAA